MHVIGHGGGRRDDRVEAIFDAIPRVGARPLRHAHAVVFRQEVEEVAGGE